MGDFALDLSPGAGTPRFHKAAEQLCWFPDTKLFHFEHTSYRLTVSRSDGSDLWHPATVAGQKGRLIVSIAGRIALEPTQWLCSNVRSATGGQACRAVAEIYHSKGLSGIEALSGNFTVIILDEGEGQCHLVTDRAGMLLAYAPTASQPLVFASHPDLLANALGYDQDFDPDSLAEFLTTGRLSFPHTYYRGVKALKWGTTYSFNLREAVWAPQKPSQYFELRPQFEFAANVNDLADEFSTAFRNAIRLRSLPLLGKTAVAMSGGMDSRAVLSATGAPEHVEGFTLIDAPNAESAAAQAVADACGTRFHLVQRAFDHYGAAAEAGARIGGGMGALASNHFLGVRPWLQEQGFQNILTGCYSDYLFKALALNTQERRFSREETLAPIRPDFYRPILRGATRRWAAVEARLDAMLSPGIVGLNSEALFNLECQRTFPLAYEGDSAQRVIAQRVLPWCVPMADKGLLEVYQRIPAHMKLNGTLFREMLRRVCPPAVLNVPNSNTGASILAGRWTRAYHRYRSALLNRLNARTARGIAGRGSWPNWDYYIQNSTVLRTQWERDSADSGMNILREILSDTVLQRDITSFRGPDVELFHRIWTLKLWLASRCSAKAGTAVAPAP
jgi:asparagine synthase (glutamine-hydrolysing)